MGPIVDLPYRALRETKPTFNSDSRHEKYYRPKYKIIAVLMAGAGVILGIGVAAGVSHAVFWLEAAEIIPFGAFWTLQTGEGWSSGTTANATAPAAPTRAK